MTQHIHHIIPKHMGGTDDPSNLVSLTVEQHAEAHKKLYEEHGKVEDYVAWKGLTGELSNQEAVQEGRRMGGLKAGGIKNWTQESWDKARTAALNNQKSATEAALSDESKAKRKETFAKINHQKGKTNSNYGKRWIHSLVEKRSKCIPKNDPLPNGWIEGRKMKFVDVM